MFTPDSALEVEDLIYAVRNRQELLELQIKEAVEKDQSTIAEDLGHELSRLNVMLRSLETHEHDTDYRNDILSQMADIVTD